MGILDYIIIIIIIIIIASMAEYYYYYASTHMVCIILCALNDAFRRTSESCAAIEPSLVAALARSSQPCDNRLYRNHCGIMVRSSLKSCSFSVFKLAKLRNVGLVDSAVPCCAVLYLVAWTAASQPSGVPTPS